MDEERLVKLIARGDQAAFEEFYRRTAHLRLRAWRSASVTSQRVGGSGGESEGSGAGPGAFPCTGTYAASARDFMVEVLAVTRPGSLRSARSLGGDTAMLANVPSA
ncbi:MAG: hypothetical protein ACRDVZ_14760 [Jiangellaceae bacterium]